MPFGPSPRSDLECTTASAAAGVGVAGSGNVGGVSSATVSPPAGTTTNSNAHPCSSPSHPPRTTVQLVGSSSSGGYNAASSSAVPPAVGAADDAEHAAFTRSPNSPIAAKSPTPSAVPGASAPLVALPAIACTAPGTSSAPRNKASITRSSSSTLLPSVCPNSFAQSSAFSPISDESVRSRRPGGSRRSGVGRATTGPTPSSAMAQGSAERAPLNSVATSACSTSSATEIAAITTEANRSESTRTYESPSRAQRESYFRANNIPQLFNELGAALLEAQPQEPVEFIKEWLRRRREHLAE